LLNWWDLNPQPTDYPKELWSSPPVFISVATFQTASAAIHKRRFEVPCCSGSASHGGLAAFYFPSATPQAEGAAVFLPEAPRVARRDFHAHFNSSVGEPLIGALLVHRNALRVAGFDHRGCASAAIRAVPAGFLARTPHLRLALVGSISRLHHRLKKCSLPGE
jgi:hypothetical protein